MRDEMGVTERNRKLRAECWGRSREGCVGEVGGGKGRKSHRNK